VKLKTNGGGVSRVAVEVVRVLPLVEVLHTPLLGVTVWAVAGNKEKLSNRAAFPRRIGEQCLHIALGITTDSQ